MLMVLMLIQLCFISYCCLCTVGTYIFTRAINKLFSCNTCQKLPVTCFTYKIFMFNKTLSRWNSTQFPLIFKQIRTYCSMYHTKLYNRFLIGIYLFVSSKRNTWILAPRALGSELLQVRFLANMLFFSPFFEK